MAIYADTGAASCKGAGVGHGHDHKRLDHAAYAVRTRSDRKDHDFDRSNIHGHRLGPLRTFFRPAASTPRLCGTSTIAANFTLNNPSVIIVNRNADQSFKDITVWGGGWGRGHVDEPVRCAEGRARAGQNFLQILKAYYTGVDVGSYPIDIGRNPGSGTTAASPVILRGRDWYVCHQTDGRAESS